MEKLYNGNSEKAGIYKIINKTNGKFYIGSTKQFDTRASQHEKQLKDNKHQNTHLQNAWNLDGTDNFLFEVIQVIEGSKQDRLDAEQLLLDQYWDGCVNCYNMEKYAKMPPSQKGSKANLGKKRTQETKDKISKWQKGISFEKKYGTEKAKEIKQKMSKNHNSKSLLNLTGTNGKPTWNKGISPTEETIEKIRQATYKQFIEKGHPRTKIWNIKLQSPIGEIFGPINNLSQFCKEYDLNCRQLRLVINKKQKSHKGWHLFKE